MSGGRREKNSKFKAWKTMKSGKIDYQTKKKE